MYAYPCNPRLPGRKTRGVAVTMGVAMSTAAQNAGNRKLLPPRTSSPKHPAHFSHRNDNAQ